VAAGIEGNSLTVMEEGEAEEIRLSGMTARRKAWTSARWQRGLPPARLLRRSCELDQDSQRLLETAINKLGLSARAYNRILKISRTIADLADVEPLTSAHIAEAIQYRSLDRSLT
jgi:magnesium chelatase family protein